MDKQEREAREMTKALPFKERAKNFWFYNKWRTIGGIFAILLLLGTLYECATQKQYDLEIFYVSESAISGETLYKIEEYFSQFVEDINGDGVNNVLVGALSADQELSAEQAYAAHTRLVAELTDGKSMAFLVDESYFAMFESEAMEGVAESTLDLNTVPQFKETVGYQEDTLYLVTKSLYEHEADDSKKQMAHENAKRLDAGLRTVVE